MKIDILIKQISFLFLLCYSIESLSQEHNITYKELLTTKTYENVYEFGWLPTAYREIPCFRDYRNNNFKMTMKNSKNGKSIELPQEKDKTALKIISDKIKIDKKNKRIIISGEITGAWEHVTPGEFEIYIGQKKDTISNITLSPNLHGDIFYNGRKVDSTIVVDTVPAFYLKNFKKFSATRSYIESDKKDEQKIIFDINSEFDEKSSLIFAVSSRYVEIFNIGVFLRREN